MSQDILHLVETFLSYSDDKLEELSQKNQTLHINHQKGEEEVCDIDF